MEHGDAIWPGFRGAWHGLAAAVDRPTRVLSQENGCWTGVNIHPMSSADHDHEIAIKGGSIDLSDLGHLLPGMAEVMPLVGERIWKCYYAGKAKNKPLARFQLSEAVNLMQKGAILRPKYAENMDKFIDDKVGAVKKCIESDDWEGFESAFAAMIESANAYHEEYDKGFLRWKIPDQPPPDLDLTPL